jgi:hypothetical protein
MLETNSVEQHMNPRNAETRRLPNGCDQDHATQENKGSRSPGSANAELLQTDIDSSKKQERKYLPKQRQPIGPALLQLDDSNPVRVHLLILRSSIDPSAVTFSAARSMIVLSFAFSSLCIFPGKNCSQQQTHLVGSAHRFWLARDAVT